MFHLSNDVIPAPCDCSYFCKCHRLSAEMPENIAACRHFGKRGIFAGRK